MDGDQPSGRRREATVKRSERFLMEYATPMPGYHVMGTFDPNNLYEVRQLIVFVGHVDRGQGNIGAQVVRVTPKVHTRKRRLRSTLVCLSIHAENGGIRDKR